MRFEGQKFDTTQFDNNSLVYIDMGNALQIKIMLADSNPVVWRRVLIADTSSFADLHSVIRDAMGWDGSHLHGFALTTKKSKPPILIGPPSPDSMFKTLSEKKELVVDWLGKKAKECLYNYDYGDNWDHIVGLENILATDPGAVYPRCVDGGMACPPDDCGGIWGYYDKLEILKNPMDKDYEWTREWMSEDFDPVLFDPSAVVFSEASDFSPWDEEEDEDEESDDFRYINDQPYIAPPKIGRNEPCPCGSNKKYKKCCGANI